MKGGNLHQPQSEADTAIKAETYDITVPNDPLARAWADHRYGLQALKPALEPVIVFQKPYEGRPIDNITQTGAGALNIAAGKIGTESIPSNRWTDNAHPFGGGAGNEYETIENSGRWPANFYVDDQTAERLDKQSGELVVSGSAKSGKPATNQEDYSKPYHIFSGIGKKQGTLHNDSGGASRFFFNVSTQIDEADPVYYCAKASQEERNAGLSAMDSITVNDGRKAESDRPHLRAKTQRKNPHPTVKPIDLCRYLAKLLLPPAAYAPRRIFIPFAGVGSEMIGAMQAGFEHVTGVEITESYIPIAQARIEYWAARGWQTPLFEMEESQS